MFVRKTPKGKDYVVYSAESYRDVNGKQKQRVVENLGLLSKLIQKDPDAFEKLKAKYREMKSKNVITLSLDNGIHNAKSAVNYGYFFAEAIYDGLGITNFVKKYANRQKFKYDLNAILKMLVFSRIIKPTSKKATIAAQRQFFGPFDNKINNTYRSLSVLNAIQNDVQIKMHKAIMKKLSRKLDVVLYDITNYYFETEQSDRLKKPGISKERRENPIVQMGLLIDQNKIPIGYELFPGNTHDSRTAFPMTEKLKTKFGVKRAILVADKGVNTSSNLAKIVNQGDGYIVSQKVRGSKQSFIDQILNDNNYKYLGKSTNFKYNELCRTRTVRLDSGIDVILKEKVVVFWSQNFDAREKAKRMKLVEKIEGFLHSPSRLNASNAFGVKRYIKTKHLDKTTGEVTKASPLNVFDKNKYDRDVALDGFYSIVTSETKKPVSEILANYKELWKIEESFKVIKSDLEGRPVFVRREDRIEGHFLTCFIALTILRIIEKKLDYKYHASRIRKSLAKANCKEIKSGYYSFESQDEVLKTLEKLTRSFISRETLEYREIKEYKKGINNSFFKE